MSFSAKRLELAAALTSVADVTGHATRPSTPAIGDGWPVLGPFVRQGGTAFLVTWRVRVMLPQDEDAASSWLDAHWDALFYALEPHGSVRQASPALLASAGGELYALEITMIAEE